MSDWRERIDAEIRAKTFVYRQPPFTATESHANGETVYTITTLEDR